MTVRKPLVVIAGQVQELPAGDTTPGSSGGGGTVITGSFTGAVALLNGKARYKPPADITLTGAFASAGVASINGDVTVAVKKNGSTIAAPTIAEGGYKSTTVSLSTALLTTDYLTLDVTAAGAGAEDVTVMITAV
jgi:hypothetical protein